MTIEHKSAASTISGDYGVVSGPKPGDTEVNTVEMEALPDEYKGALEADDFVIYGLASIEQYDDDDPKTLLEMSALEAGLDRFFESENAPGIISVGHKDVPVGKPLRSYQLEEATDIPVGDEVYSFEPGDTLETHVEETGEDGRPRLWLAANIDGDTQMGKKARMRALSGALDGFSVTIHRNKAEWETENKRRVTDLDLMAVTLGSDEQIRNKGSEFGVAEYKAAVTDMLGAVSTRTDDAMGQLAEDLVADTESKMTNFSDKVLAAVFRDQADKLENGEAAENPDEDEEEAQDGEDGELDEHQEEVEAEDVSEDVADDTEDVAEPETTDSPDTPGDTSAETETAAVEGKAEEETEGKMQVEKLADKIAQATGADKAEIMQILRDAGANTPDAGEDSEGDSEGEGDDDTEQDGTEEQDGAVMTKSEAEAMINARMQELEGKMVTEDDLDDQVSEFKGAMEDVMSDATEEIESKAVTGGTPSPTGGSTADEQDLKQRFNDVAQRHGSK